VQLFHRWQRFRHRISKLANRSCTNAYHLHGARCGAWQQDDTPSDKVKKIKSWWPLYFTKEYCIG
jgi:hypothetical protein